jgi:hypothetical protein
MADSFGFSFPLPDLADVSPLSEPKEVLAIDIRRGCGCTLQEQHHGEKQPRF